MHRTDAALLALALAGILVLAGLARWSEPDRMPLADAAAHEGARVAVEAEVLRFSAGPRSAFLVLADDGARLDAFAPRKAAVAPGDLVRAVGVVTRGERALVLDVERVDVLAPAGARVLDVAELAAHAADHDGARLLVRGEATKGALAGGGAKVRLDGLAPPAEGWWLASGTFRYREKETAYVLDVDAWRRP